MRCIHGGSSGNRLAAWNGAIQSFAILQKWRSNTVRKNAAAITLMIDAMDFKRNGTTNGFRLVNSDSDFTRRAPRLHADGIAGKGFGECQTPPAFRHVCSRVPCRLRLIPHPE